MRADQDQPELSADEVVAELRSAGITLTSQNLQAMAAAHKAASERVEAADRETERRHRPRSLLVLTPEFMDEGTPQKWAKLKELDAWKVHGRWFSTIANMEEWLIRTDRFPNKEAEERWRASMLRRFP
jgi:hypothetical protein